MIVGPRYNDVDHAVEAAYQRAAEAETATRLDAVAARLEAATPGPWEAVTDNDGRTKEHSVWSEQSSDYVAEWIVTKPDADLIAHAPADLAALLAVVREVAALESRWHADPLFDTDDAMQGIRDALDPLTTPTKEND